MRLPTWAALLAIGFIGYITFAYDPKASIAIAEQATEQQQ